MNILEIYKKYQIMPQLAEHQFKVAAVAEIILNHSSLILDRDDIVAACLLHDMGNIVKFDFNQSKEMALGLIDLSSLKYWEKVKREFLSKYGSGSHNVTMRIIDELQVSKRIRELVNCVGFEQAPENAKTSDFGKKICAYADMRVMPLGVGSLEDRMADLRVRYKNHPEGANNREVFEVALRKIEKQIFEHCGIAPSDISGGVVAGRIEKLKSFEI